MRVRKGVYLLAPLVALALRATVGGGARGPALRRRARALGGAERGHDHGHREGAPRALRGEPPRERRLPRGAPSPGPRAGRARPARGGLRHGLQRATSAGERSRSERRPRTRTSCPTGSTSRPSRRPSRRMAPFATCGPGSAFPTPPPRSSSPSAGWSRRRASGTSWRRRPACPACAWSSPARATSEASCEALARDLHAPVRLHGRPRTERDGAGRPGRGRRGRHPVRGGSRGERRRASQHAARGPRRPGAPSSPRAWPASRTWSRTAITGLLVPPADPGALAEALRRLAADPALRRSAGHAGEGDRRHPLQLDRGRAPLRGVLCRGVSAGRPLRGTGSRIYDPAERIAAGPSATRRAARCSRSLGRSAAKGRPLPARPPPPSARSSSCASTASATSSWPFPRSPTCARPCPSARIRLAVGGWSAALARRAPVDDLLVWSAPWVGRRQEGADSWRALLGRALRPARGSPRPRPRPAGRRAREPAPRAHGRPAARRVREHRRRVRCSPTWFPSTRPSPGWSRTGGPCARRRRRRVGRPRRRPRA